MNSGKHPVKATIGARMPCPFIIGHNCGYKGYNLKIYSKAATKRAYRDCDYLEIDLIRKIVGREYKWWYYHPGQKCKYKRGEKGNRKTGISFDLFLSDFRSAAKESKREFATDKQKLGPGIFLDLKEHLCCSQVYDLMDYLNEKYDKELIPKGTPLMIFTGRGGPRVGVYRDTTRYFVKWLYKNQGNKILKRSYCRRLTLVTREVKLKEELINWEPGILGRFRESALIPKEKAWFWKNYKRKFWWAFNPELFWLLRYDFEQIVKKEIAVIPWFETHLSKIRKFLEKIRHPRKPAKADMAVIPKKLEENPSGWIKVIFGVLGEYWLYKGSRVKDVKPPPWGIITYAPNRLKKAFQKYSFPTRLVR